MNLNLVDLQVNQSFIGAKILSKPINIAQIKWCASSLWSFRPNSAWGSNRDNDHREDAPHVISVHGPLCLR